MKSILLLIVLTPLLVLAQIPKEVKSITKKNVSRIIKTLSADDMMGRPASDPAKIEKATAFIENEFKSIGLKKMEWLSSYRQEFSKARISPGTLEVTINDKRIPATHSMLYSEEAEINISSGLEIKKIEFDANAKNPRQYLFRAATVFTRDSASVLVIIDARYQDTFKEMKGYMESRFLSNRKGNKIFVVGDYEPTSYTVKATQNKKPLILNNVIGILPGKTKPDEIVVFSAHYDHLGIIKPVEGDSIANGADDDASGTTAVIELARYFKKKNNNSRTLVFVAFTAEEMGGFGSQYFSEQMNPDKVVAMFNIEMIGKESKFGKNTAFITGYERSDFGEILNKNLTATQFKFHPDPYPEQNLFYRSDNATLARQGVPAHSISTDQIPTDKLYHSVNDEFESMDIENIVSAIQAIALSSKTIVGGEDTPKRIDKSTLR
jgi:Zn-dependent M28 family amino/carboxypeptidase